MLLIHPPVAKICEPPAGIASLAGSLHSHNLDYTLLDANLEGMLFLIDSPVKAADTWSRRACRNVASNLAALRSPEIYKHRARYQRSVTDLNRKLTLSAQPYSISLSLANYQDHVYSPLQSRDLLQAAAYPEKNIFYDYFSRRLPQLLENKQSAIVGFSLNYLSQAICTFAMVGFLKKLFPDITVVLGGGLVTSWLQNSVWKNCFAGLIDHMIGGPGGKPLLALLGRKSDGNHHSPRYDTLPISDYLAPGFILPYAASSGCYWNKCSFCPEKAEKNPYSAIKPDKVIYDIDLLIEKTSSVLLHFLDNAISPVLMDALIACPPGVNWYGFARIDQRLAELEFCKALRKSGCVMLKLGIESGDQTVLNKMEKGIDLTVISKALSTLKQAGIATYVYLLFGTPAESIEEARHTMEFVCHHSEAITYLNLAVFNMPVSSPEAKKYETSNFYDGDLTLYTDFEHPRGWNRHEVRRFLDQEFRRHPAIKIILHRDPPYFTSNHAPLFS